MSLANIKFSKPTHIPSYRGDMYMRKWQIPNDETGKAFWKFWKAKKTQMMGRGFKVVKNKMIWELQEWHKNLSDFPEYKIEPDIELVSDLTVKPLIDESGLRPWQIPAAAQLAASIREHGAAIDGSDTGTGKTYAAIGTARELKLDVAVVCPKAVITSWKRAIEDHFGLNVTFVLNYEALKGDKYPHIIQKVRSKKSVNITYQWNIPKNTLLIFDESHRLKGRDTINSKLAKAAKRQGYKILCCSATNAVNPLEMDTVGYILGLHNTGNTFWGWVKNNGCKKGTFGMQFNGDRKVLRKLHKAIFLDRGVRLKKSDIPDFPDSEIITEPYDMDDKITKKINMIYADLKEELKAKRYTGGHDLVLRTRARQEIELLKADLFIEMTEDLVADGNSVVIMVNFTETIQYLSKKLKTKCMIHGGNKGDERQQFIDAFQADEERIMLLNIQAGGVGVSLHDLNGNHPRVALISPNDSAPLLRQAFGRVHRAGALTKSQQRVIFVANTVEEDVCANVKIKLNNMDKLNDGDLCPELESMLRE